MSSVTEQILILFVYPFLYIYHENIDDRGESSTGLRGIGCVVKPQVLRLVR